MPYKLKKTKGGYKVQTKSGPNKGRAYSKKPLSHARAVAQLRALYVNTGGK